MVNTLQHVGVKGMRWGVRKKYDPTGDNSGIDFRKDAVVIKRGTEIHRLSSVQNETHKGSGYASFLKKDAEAYAAMGSVFSKVGMTQYDMTFKASKDLISPSQKERVDVFLNKMKDPAFVKELNHMRSKMLILNLTTPGDLSFKRDNPELTMSQVKAYRLLNAAISGNKNLRSQYLDEFKKRKYDFILDENDASNKQAIAPIIFIERAGSLDIVDVKKL